MTYGLFSSSRNQSAPSLPRPGAKLLVRTASACRPAVPPENPQALAEAIKTLSSDHIKYKALAEASLTAAPGHSREQQAKDMIHVLELAGRGDGNFVGAEINENSNSS